MVTITTDNRSYMISIKDVEQKKIQKSKRILEKKNFDGQFELNVV